MNRIIFTGAQGTGKTTILNEFRNQGKNVITEVVRNLAKEGIKINEMGDEKGQKKIFSTYEKLLSEQVEYISDRGLIDVLAYTMHLNKRGLVSDKLVKSQFNALKKFVKNNQDIIYCYFPIEFGVIDDGVRSLDEDYRREIDNNIKEILISLGAPWVTIRGGVDARVNMVNMFYQWLEAGVILFAEAFQTLAESCNVIDKAE
jgi:predicted ATPase